jgi:putative serine protease PepD
MAAMSTFQPTGEPTGEPTAPATPATPSAAWWISESQPLPTSVAPRRTGGISFYVALVIALIAGSAGAVVTRIVLGGNTGLVSVNQSIERAPNSIAGIAARVSPSVVEVDSTSSEGQDTGTGFFIESSGYILTNNHVIESAVLSNGSINVKLKNNRQYSATVVGRDTSYDLAVLKISVVGAPALTLGNSDRVQVGDPVIAIGSPLGLAGTVTSGIISAKNRPVTTSSTNQAGESSYIDALQTDAAINPGNSGGPLVDASGAVIGVNSAIASLNSSGFGSQPGSIGLGFAIPINQAKRTADQLIKTGHSNYPIMGLSLDSAFQGAGAQIAKSGNAIRAGGPAAKAGLQAGDVITAFDGQPIGSSDDLVVAVRAHNVGDTVAVTFTRGTVTKTVHLTLIASK